MNNLLIKLSLLLVVVSLTIATVLVSAHKEKAIWYDKCSGLSYWSSDCQDCCASYGMDSKLVMTALLSSQCGCKSRKKAHGQTGYSGGGSSIDTVPKGYVAGY